MDKSTLINISILVIISTILIVISLLVLSNFENQVYEHCCNELNGTLVFYECQDMIHGFRDKDYIPCNKLKTGYYCNIDGIEINANNLSCMVNITNSI